MNQPPPFRQIHPKHPNSVSSCCLMCLKQVAGQVRQTKIDFCKLSGKIQATKRSMSLKQSPDECNKTRRTSASADERSKQENDRCPETWLDSCRCNKTTTATNGSTVDGYRRENTSIYVYTYIYIYIYILAIFTGALITEI